MLVPELVAAKQSIHKSVLDVTGDNLDFCEWYNNGDFPYKVS
jgi:hypothetical protein